MNKIDQIIYMYNDALYCAVMLGGKDGEERVQQGLKRSKKRSLKQQLLV